MKREARVIRLGDEKFEYFSDPHESIKVFTELLIRGRALYPKTRYRKGSRKFCRIVPLKGKKA